MIERISEAYWACPSVRQLGAPSSYLMTYFERSVDSTRSQVCYMLSQALVATNNEGNILTISGNLKKSWSYAPESRVKHGDCSLAVAILANQSSVSSLFAL